MFVWCVVEHALEVGGAGREDHLVGLQVEPVAGDGDIDKGLVVEEVFKDGEKVGNQIKKKTRTQSTTNLLLLLLDYNK